MRYFLFFFFQAEDGIRDTSVTGVQTCALPIFAEGVKRAVPAADQLYFDRGTLCSTSTPTPSPRRSSRRSPDRTDAAIPKVLRVTCRSPQEWRNSIRRTRAP